MLANSCWPEMKLKFQHLDQGKIILYNGKLALQRAFVNSVAYEVH